MMDHFYEQLKSNPGQKQVILLIEGMREYTVFHFEEEERLMLTHQYPDFDAHKKEHELFKLKVSDLETRYRNNKLVISIEVTSFLKDWINHHIKTVDSKYSLYLTNKGVK